MPASTIFSSTLANGIVTLKTCAQVCLPNSHADTERFLLPSGVTNSLDPALISGRDRGGIPSLAHVVCQVMHVADGDSTPLDIS